MIQILLFGLIPLPKSQSKFLSNDIPPSLPGKNKNHVYTVHISRWEFDSLDCNIGVYLHCIFWQKFSLFKEMWVFSQSKS